MLSVAVGWRAEKPENHPVTGELVRIDDPALSGSELKARNTLARHHLMQRLKCRIEQLMRHELPLAIPIGLPRLRDPGRILHSADRRIFASTTHQAIV